MDLASPTPPATVNPSATPPASLPLVPPLVPPTGAAVPTEEAAPDGGDALNTVSDALSKDYRECRRSGGGERGLTHPYVLCANDHCTRDRCTDRGDLCLCGRAGWGCCGGCGRRDDPCG